MWNKGIGHIWVNQLWSNLAGGVPSLCPLGDEKHVVLGCFWWDMELERWLEMGRAHETNIYISAIKVKVQVWEKSVASTEKDEKVL